MALPDARNNQDWLLTININNEIDPQSDLLGIMIRPMFLDRENEVCVHYDTIQPGTALPAHLHTRTVHFFTTKSRWRSAEQPEYMQIAGSYLFEPGGSIHTFMIPTDATESTKGFMVVNGANVNFVDGKYHSMMDTCVIQDGILGAIIAGLIPIPRCIGPKGGAQFSTT